MDGVKRALRAGIIPKQKIFLETDAPFMYPKVTGKKLQALLEQN
jgi:Tat protein secretion system quality control protein TatD with DNase activity